MDTVNVDQFSEHLESYLEQVVANHTRLKVALEEGEGVVVLSAGDWEREQETLYVLQNSSLMKQIADSLAAHYGRSG